MLIPDIDAQLAAHFRMPEGKVVNKLVDDPESTDERLAEQARMRAKRAQERFRQGAEWDRHEKAAREAAKRDLEARRAMARRMGITMDALRKRMARGSL